GLVPISAMITSSELLERAYGQHYAAAEAHNTTFSGNSVACVAAHAALDLLTDELIARVKDVGDRYRANLAAKLARHALFGGIMGAGLIIGIALQNTDHPWLSYEHSGVDELADQPTAGVLVCHRMYKRGYYCFVCGHDWSVLRLQPRFAIPEPVLDTFVTA